MTRNEERAIDWECQSVLRQYYHHVDQRQYDEVVQLFTPDVHWLIMGLDLHGREAVRGAFGGLAESTIRHVLTNAVVTVIDEDHAEARSYLGIYVEKGFPTDGPIPFEGPDRLSTSLAKLRRTDDEGWLIAERGSEPAFVRERA